MKIRTMMEIRFLTSDDAGEWWRLRKEALLGDPEAFSASGEEHEPLGLEEVRKRLGSEDGERFVVGAFEDGRLNGMAGFYREKGLKSRHKGRVWGVYVTPATRGEGVGDRMMQALLQRGSAIEGIEQILLSVTTTQVSAVRLYRSLGFESFGREPRALKIGERFIDEEFMILPVKRG
ncbi:MAG TPA: N-acetyltransferase [Candidatus Sulfotelmatobacter sp.]|nr:N-acetyltransferase [Candidatus Sulfotelmatobacter sp.]